MALEAIPNLCISIHAPRGGSDAKSKGGREFVSCISIHAPRGGSDHRELHAVVFLGISIHAPRGGSDYRRQRGERDFRYFNPRSPWGERLRT